MFLLIISEFKKNWRLSEKFSDEKKNPHVWKCCSEVGKGGLKMGAFRGLQGNVNITGSFSARTDCTCTCTDCTCTFIVCMCEYVYSVAVFCGVLL